MKKLFIKVIIFIFIITNFAYSDTSKSTFIKDVNIMFLREDYAGVVKDVESGISSHRLNTNEKKELFYIEGLACLKLGKFQQAREIFKKILDIGGESYRQEAYIGIADSFFLEKNYDSAIKAYENVISMYSRSDMRSVVYKNLGASYEAKGDAKKANYYFQKIRENYSKSFEAGQTPYMDTRKETQYYIVQLGAFSSLTNAKNLVNSLARKRFDSYIQKTESDNHVIYRVRCGKFSNESYAYRLVKNLEKNGFQAKIIEE